MLSYITFQIFSTVKNRINKQFRTQVKRLTNDNKKLRKKKMREIQPFKAPQR